MELRTNDTTILISKIFVSNHAYERYIERFPIKEKSKNKGHVTTILRRALQNSQYVGLKKSGSGKDGHLFVASKLWAGADIEMYLSTDLRTVMTVYPKETIALTPYDYSIIPYPVQKKINDLYSKEYRKMERVVRKKEKDYQSISLEIDAECAALRLRIHKTRSQSVKMMCEVRVKELNRKREEFEIEVATLKTTRKKIAKHIFAI